MEPSENNPQWERQVLEKIALESLKEIRAKRAWVAECERNTRDGAAELLRAAYRADATAGAIHARSACGRPSPWWSAA